MQFSEDKYYYCEVICSNEYPFEIITEQICVNNCSINLLKVKKCIIKYEKEINEEYEEEKDNSNENKDKKEAEDVILENFENNIKEYDTSDIDKGTDDIFENNQMTITLTTSDNQKNNNDNVTIINLGECEDKLRKFYKLNEEDKIYIKKIDLKQEGMKIPRIEFNVYSKLNGTNLIMLNLSLCSNDKIKIDLVIPIKISENLDKLNSSSDYYNDICYLATSESGTDIPLKDRKKEFIDKNRTICQENCIFSEYDYNNLKAICKCKVKESPSNTISDMKFNTTILLSNFANIKNIANLNILKCYQVLFNLNVILINIGFYVIIVIFIFHLIYTIFIHKKQLDILNNKAGDIIFCLKNWKIYKAYEKVMKKKLLCNKIKFKNDDSAIKNNNLDNNNHFL